MTQQVQESGGSTLRVRIDPQGIRPSDPSSAALEALAGF